MSDLANCYGAVPRPQFGHRNNTTIIAQATSMVVKMLIKIISAMIAVQLLSRTHVPAFRKPKYGTGVLYSDDTLVILSLSASPHSLHHSPPAFCCCSAHGHHDHTTFGQFVFHFILQSCFWCLLSVVFCDAFRVNGCSAMFEVTYVALPSERRSCAECIFTWTILLAGMDRAILQLVADMCQQDRFSAAVEHCMVCNLW